MAKLVDALVSGTSVSNDVQVRVLFWAQKTAQRATAQRNNCLCTFVPLSLFFAQMVKLVDTPA